MTLDRKNFEKIFGICVLTGFMGQIYLNPFSTGFRISFSVFVLSLLLIYFKDIPIMMVTTTLGISISLFRSFVYMVGHEGVILEHAIGHYYPVAIFYSLFGILFEILDVRYKMDKPVIFVASLWFCDSFSNIVELIIYKDPLNYPFERAVLTLIVIGFIRALLTFFIYHLIVYYINRYEREKKENKYRELILLIANLKAELFFLRKSIMDIENAMNKSYGLYEKIEKEDLKDDALEVAKDIHEIKKDYIRVVTGMEKILVEENKGTHMEIKEIFHMIQENTKRLIHMEKKNIVLSFKWEENFLTSEFYPFISIINNLIINGVEAIEDVGIIKVTQQTQGEEYLFKVIDNGPGIDQEDLELIFEPGFSTKFNTVTGEMSTGIGLNHAKYIVENYFGGEIYVKSQNNQTIFTIKIPKKKLAYRKW